MADIEHSSIEEEEQRQVFPVSLEEEVGPVQTSITSTASSNRRCGGFDIDEFSKEHLICQQCNKRYTDPVTLPCLHSYCNGCLHQCIMEQIPSFSAPTEDRPLEEIPAELNVLQDENQAVPSEIVVVPIEVPVIHEPIPSPPPSPLPPPSPPAQPPPSPSPPPSPPAQPPPPPSGNHEEPPQSVVEGESSTVSPLPATPQPPSGPPSRHTEGRSLSQIIDGPRSEQREQDNYEEIQEFEQEVEQEIEQEESEESEEEEVREKEIKQEVINKDTHHISSSNGNSDSSDDVSSKENKNNLQYVPHNRDIVQHSHDNFTCQRGGCNISLQKDNLPSVNKSLSNLVQTAQLKDDLASGQVKCKECVDEGIVEWICTDKKCDNKLLCNDCYRDHKRKRDTTEHRVVKVDPEKDDWWEDLNRSTWFCTRHEGRRVDVYCKTHKVLICERCGSLDGHSNCSKTDVDEVYREEREQLNDKLLQLKELLLKFEGAIENGENVIQKLTNKRDDTIKALEIRCDHFVKPLIAERNRLIEKTEKICELKTNEINEHQKALKRVAETLKDSLKFMNDYSQEAIASEFMFLKSQFDQRVSDLFDRYDDNNFDLSPADNDQLIYRPNEGASLSPFMLGDVESTACVKEFGFLKPHCPQDQLLLYDTSYKFLLQCRDIAETHVSHRVMPEIEAYVCPSSIDFDTFSRHCVKCKVDTHSGQGKYTITIPPLQTVEQHELHIYGPRPYPKKQYYVKKCPLSIYVALPTLM